MLLGTFNVLQLKRNVQRKTKVSKRKEAKKRKGEDEAKVKYLFYGLLDFNDYIH